MENLGLIESIQSKIYIIRDQRVMLDRDLAALYQVETRVLNQAVSRNLESFPSDFMFQLNKDEYLSLRSQSVILKRGAHRKYYPYAFTEHGILMLSSVLKSLKARQVNIQIMRTFVKLRELLTLKKDISLKLDLVIKTLNEHDGQIKSIYAVLEQLLEAPVEEKNRIGFV